MAHESDHKRQFKNRKEKIGWYLDEIDCYKEDMGKWYTLGVRIILPFLLFIIPFNKLVYHGFEWIRTHFLLGIIPEFNETIPLCLWMLVCLIFLAILIFLPRFATFCEFVSSFGFYYLAFTVTYMVEQGGKLVERGFITNGLGYFTIISLSIFMFMKLVFLVFEIAYKIVFRGETEPKAYKDEANEIVF